MNGSIQRLFVVVVLLFTLLVVWTSRWTVFDATALKNDPLNKLGHFRSLTIERGRILAGDGTVLARSVKAGGGTWGRHYPEGSLFSQAVGYFNAVEGTAAGVEESRSSELEGTPTGISSVFGPLGGSQQVGDDVDTTLDTRAQQLARTLLRGRAGSVVAIVPQTGAIPVMYSNPTYDDNHPTAPCTDIDGIGCQTNLATSAALPPGSTFKIVTTTAALNSGRYTPDSIVVGNSPITVSGVPLENDGNQSWGPITLTKALTYSVNTVYAQVGEALGKQTMFTYMKRFGFYSIPPLDYPRNEMIASGERLYDPSRLLPATSPFVDIGRTAIGQAKLAVTPLQMAMVAATVADHGTLMTPHLTTKIVNQDGVVVDDVKPTVYHRVMRPSVAAELTRMMTDVVEEGTGTAANLDGLDAAGKTGTAQVENNSDLDDAWFIGFAPIADPKIAVAVELDDIPNGYGGVYAAPIAAQEMKLMISEGL